MSRRRNRQRNHRRPAAKALIPAGTPIAGQTIDRATPLAELLHQANRYTLNSNPMARDPWNNNTFGPGDPLQPAALDPVRPDTDRPEPRGSEYPVSWNLRIGPDRAIPWTVLRDAADGVDIIRRCIQVRKKHVRGLKWSWTVSADAIQAAYQADPRRGEDDITAELRDKYAPAIARLNAFWTNPWRGHLKGMGAWLNMLQEEVIVLDALPIYPQRTIGGDVHSFQIIDGTTIKPLLTSRGFTPAPPYPAYQQILYGFPRGEFTATPVTDEAGRPVVDERGDPVIEEPMDADELFYWRENPRTFTPYGLSDVEQALIGARLYLARQGWMVAEYTDGSTPVTWLVPDGTGSGEMDFRQRRKWQDALNDELSGHTRNRQRIKVAPPGFKPEMPPTVDERYKPDYDLHLIKLVASHLGVTIAELGFTEAKGLGSSGYHEGAEDVQDRIGRRPDTEMLAEIIMCLSRDYLDAPPELEFAFTGLESEDEASADQVADNQVKSGRTTLNEDRRRRGLPLFNFAEADMPMVIGQRGVVFLEDASKLAPPGEMIGPVQASPATAPPEGGGAAPGSQNTPPDGNTPAAKAKPAKTVPVAKSAAADSAAVRDAVRDQLAEDYPPDALSWLDQATWTGPDEVPLDRIDYDGADSWEAAHEPEKVDRMRRKIERGKRKPIVLIQRPDGGLLRVGDGHHRALAYRDLGQPPTAYIARVPAAVGPWDEMHSAQRTSNDPGSTASAKSTEAEGLRPYLRAALKANADRIREQMSAADGAELDKAAAIELAAYRRWARKHPNAARPFTFTHPAAEQAAKAGGADPKGRTWPGWERDEAAAAHWAEQLRHALTGGVDTRGIAADWLAQRTTPAKAAGDDLDDDGDADSWLTGAGITAAVALILWTVLRDAWTEGWFIGDRSATAMAGYVSVDWSGWKPGDPDAARLILGDTGRGAGLARLLDEGGVRIKSVAANRVDQLAQALADALANGDSADTLAARLRTILDDPKWADLVAVTEINRAVSAATLEVYAANGIPGKSWMTAADDRVCPTICEPNGIDGAIPLNAAFTSGDTMPPGHPKCRCALAPEFLTTADTDMSTADLSTGGTT